MKTEANNEPICDRCRFGADTSHGCQCPDLDNEIWDYFDPTEERENAYRDACCVIRHKITEGRLPKDFSPIPFVAVVSAVDRRKCKYYAEKREI